MCLYVCLCLRVHKVVRVCVGTAYVCACVSKLRYGDPKPCCGFFVAHQSPWTQRPRVTGRPIALNKCVHVYSTFVYLHVLVLGHLSWRRVCTSLFAYICVCVCVCLRERERVE